MTEQLSNRLSTDEIARLRSLLDLFREDVVLPFKRLHPNATLPAKSGEDEACYDFTCVADANFEAPNSELGVQYDVECPFVLLQPGDSYNFKTGVACAIPQGRAMYLWDRSGMGAKKNIHRLAGVIDCTYRGEWIVCLTNLSKSAHVIQAGDKIIQGQLALVLPGTPVWTDELPESYRGEAGFGSTGR
jgi:dUTP pyrophosphatase